MTSKKSAKPPNSDPALDDDEDRSDDPSVGVGSVAAGGRYDNLVGMFSGKKQIPCVGISFGVDRLFSLIKQRIEADESAATIRNNEVEVYVMAFGGKGFTGMLKERMQVCTILWNAGIKVLERLTNASCHDFSIPHYIISSLTLVLRLRQSSPTNKGQSCPRSLKRRRLAVFPSRLS